MASLHPTTNSGMQNKSSVGSCTHCMHVLCTFAPRFVCSAGDYQQNFWGWSSVGTLLTVRCWLGNFTRNNILGGFNYIDTQEFNYGVSELRKSVKECVVGWVTSGGTTFQMVSIILTLISLIMEFMDMLMCHYFFFSLPLSTWGRCSSVRGSSAAGWSCPAGGRRSWNGP